MGYIVRKGGSQPTGHHRPSPIPVNVSAVKDGGASLTQAFRAAAKLAGWPRGLILEPVAHEVVGG